MDQSALEEFTLQILNRKIGVSTQCIYHVGNLLNSHKNEQCQIANLRYFSRTGPRAAVSVKSPGSKSIPILQIN